MILVMENVAFAAQLPNTDSLNESDWPSQEQAVLAHWSLAL